MDQNPFKNNPQNFSNNIQKVNENIENQSQNEQFLNSQRYQYQNHYQAQIRDNRNENERNSNDYSNFQNSNTSPFKNRNKYQEEKKDGNIFGLGNSNGNGYGISAGNSNSNSFYKNESNKKNTFGAGRNEFGDTGAYENLKEKNKMQNEINEFESINNINNRDSKKDLRYLQETQSSRNLKRIYSGVDRNIQTPRKSLQEIEEEHKKKKNAVDKCLSLYENGKIKNEVNRLLAEKNMKIKEEIELKECTFFPKTNFNDRFNGDKNVNNQVMKKLESNFFDRISSWQQKKEKK
jgi:hypothetical protein